MIVSHRAGCAALLKGPSSSILLLANFSSTAAAFQTVAFAASPDTADMLRKFNARLDFQYPEQQRDVIAHRKW